MNNIQRGKIGNCIVFHDFEDEPYDLRSWTYYAIEWFQQNGLIPYKMNITGLKERENITVKEGISLLEENNFKGVKDIWMGVFPPDTCFEMLDALASVQLNFGMRGSTLVMCFDDNILKFSCEVFEKLTKDIDGFFKPKYGYAYQREFTKGPSFYPFGVIGGNAKLSTKEETTIAKWNHHYRYDHSPYKIGDLRDIYTMSLLSEAHLNQPVFDTILKAWIKSSSDHGELKPLTNTLWKWWVPEGLIDSVREELRPTGIVICI